MKKHFITGVLLLAVTAGGFSTFTSCKDTDEDLYNQVNSKQVSLTEALKALQASLDGYVKQSDYNTKIQELENKINNNPHFTEAQIKQMISDALSEYATTASIQGIIDLFNGVNGQKSLADRLAALEKKKACDCTKDFTEDDFLYANDHLRIASICYGLLRPLDLIKPYRMEYEVKLPELGEGNMYNYWRPRQTELLIDEVKKSDNILINLASQEIQGAYDWKKVGSTVRIITPELKVWKDGKAQTIVIYMKMARGQMTRYILKNRITDPEALKNFSWEGFTYDESLSNGDNWVFLQS